jgi:hypothetical protein
MTKASLSFKSSALTYSALNLVSLGFLQWWLYWRNRHDFFQGDTIFWFDHRLHSLREFMLSFTDVDPSGWYRPLSQRTVESFGFPFWNLHPEPYRWIVFAVFFVNVVLVGKLVQALSGSRVASLIATIYFSTHTINAYTTYDVAFLPELSYTAFYLCSILSFIRHGEMNDRPYLRSVGWFALALLCKESAVTLPFVLLLVQACASDQRRISYWMRRAAYHFAVLSAYGLYFVFVFGKHHVAIAGLMPESAGGYTLSASAIGPNLYTAFLWAANLPIGESTQSGGLLTWMFAFLSISGVLLAFLLIRCLYRRERLVALGLGWFLLTMVPALPLYKHFLPYYLFLPLVGVSLALGTGVQSFITRVTLPYQRWTTLAMAVGMLLMVTINHRSITNDSRDNDLLCGSALVASHAIQDLTSQRIPLTLSGSLVILAPNQIAPPGGYADGGLFRLVGRNDSLKMVFLGNAVDETMIGSQTTITAVLLADRNRLLDVTDDFAHDRKATLTAAKGGPLLVPLSLSNQRGLEVKNEQVGVADYTIDDGDLQAAPAILGPRGVELQLPPNPRRGLYRVLRFRRSNDAWHSVDGYFLNR